MYCSQSFENIISQRHGIYNVCLSIAIATTDEGRSDRIVEMLYSTTTAPHTPERSFSNNNETATVGHATGHLSNKISPRSVINLIKHRRKKERCRCLGP